MQRLREFLSMRSTILRRRTLSARLLVSMPWSKYPAPSIPTRHLLMHQVATVFKLSLDNFSTFSSTADAIEEVQGSLKSGSCSFPSNCMWQTCWVGSDSCFWTVNCPENDKECDDMIHNSDFHVNDDPITCKACFNTACPGCEVAWDNCGNGAEMEHQIPACENGDVQEGWDCGNEKRSTFHRTFLFETVQFDICNNELVDCDYSLIDIQQSGRKRCEWPSNEKFADAVFDCPQVITILLKILSS